MVDGIVDTMVGMVNSMADDNMPDIMLSATICMYHVHIVGVLPLVVMLLDC